MQEQAAQLAKNVDSVLAHGKVLIHHQDRVEERIDRITGTGKHFQTLGKATVGEQRCGILAAPFKYRHQPALGLMLQQRWIDGGLAELGTLLLQDVGHALVGCSQRLCFRTMAELMHSMDAAMEFEWPGWLESHH